ncbi:MAG: DUF3160 domain-containing protein [Bacteroidales bacterium]|nr:DUF3160 domain-containing protein [Bacteroidales bacterium]MBN2697812.1 DUF3160 domain-containing protein [Bacteroidales bacterium]
MKTANYISLTLACVFAGTVFMNAQSTFDPELYEQYIASTASMTVQELLSENPPLTTYYSNRMYPSELKEIPWFDSINSFYYLTEAEKDMLSQNHFMVSERLPAYSWADALIDIYGNDLPLFISSDFVLSTLHNAYDAILQTLEWQYLESNLEELLAAMFDTYPALYDKYKNDPGLDGPLYDVDLYTSMAISLLYGEEVLPQKHDRELYDIILEGIRNETAIDAPLFTSGRDLHLDLSQFKPRGHYTQTIYLAGEKDKTLENYFRAMMWLGRIDFLLTAPPENPWEPDWTDSELRRMQQGALLLNELLFTCGKRENLVRHEEIIEFLVGPDDNMTPDELKGLSERLLNTPADLFDETTFDVFMDSLNASDDYGQKIMSNYFYVDPRTSDPGQLPVSFKLSGQKFLIDSYVFSEVVYDRIIYEGRKIYRALPDPLDVMAALGNEDALALLETELDSFKYAYKMASLSYLINAYDESFWEQSLYNTWLGAIRELNPPASSSGLPYFMQTTAWHHAKLNTQLTSWAQLRHDNILYGKQSYTGATGCSFPYTFIEPYPELYNRLELFASSAADFFREVLADIDIDAKTQIINYYERYEEIMGIFREIAIKELNGIPLNESEITFLKTMINEYMASGPSITGWYNDLFFSMEKALSWDFTVADVHTEPTDQFGNPVGHVLHVGNGLINQGVYFAPSPVNPSVLMAFIGPVSTFHYEVTSDFERLTDEEWEAKFVFTDPSEHPPRPDWIAEYSADNGGNHFKEGRSLKGVVYSGTEIDPGGSAKDIDYLITFPNPVQDELHLRFVLNKVQQVSINIYDTGGRLLIQPFEELLRPDEHDVQFNTSKWHPGLYLVEIRTEGELITKRVVVN